MFVMRDERRKEKRSKQDVYFTTVYCKRRSMLEMNGMQNRLKKFQGHGTKGYINGLQSRGQCI